MIYREYEILLKKYRDALERYDQLISRKEELFNQAQPQGIKYDRDRIQNNGDADAFARYAMSVEQLDWRIGEVEGIIAERRKLLTEKEAELRGSRDITDRVYCLGILDRVRVYKIAGTVHYSEAQIYRILRRIRRTMEEIRHENNQT